jgi:hypothetical protein
MLFICFVFFSTDIHMRFIQYIHPSPVAETSLIFFIACLLSVTNLSWGVEPRFELAGLPYSRPVHYTN